METSDASELRKSSSPMSVDTGVDVPPALSVDPPLDRIPDEHRLTVGVPVGDESRLPVGVRLGDGAINEFRTDDGRCDRTSPGDRKFSIDRESVIRSSPRKLSARRRQISSLLTTAAAANVGKPLRLHDRASLIFELISDAETSSDTEVGCVKT